MNNLNNSFDQLLRDSFMYPIRLDFPYNNKHFYMSMFGDMFINIEQKVYSHLKFP